MRYAVLADVHANLEALDAVLAAAAAEGAERLVCAGDLVGYHADPDACVERLRAAGALCVAGNHDRVAAGVAEPVHFGKEARRAVLWTRERLSPASRAFLAGLPLHRVVDGRFLLFHGALHPAPNADLHLSRDGRVARSIQALRDGPWGVGLAFFGHTHRAVVHEAYGDTFRSSGGPFVELSGSGRHLVNPGSVGQPRDGNFARAAFAIFDASAGGGVVRFLRVPYDASACLAKVERAGFAKDGGGGPLSRIRDALRRLR